MSIPAIPAVPAKPEVPISIPSLLAGEWAREVVMSVAHTSPRSMQAQLGPSEIGQQCERRIGYRVLNAPYVNYPDPTKSMFGTGFHAVMAEGLKRLDQHRYLIETEVSYRGIVGTVDLYDRYKLRVVDWKTSSIKRIRRYRADGVPINSQVQIAIYAEALRAMGYEVTSVALVFIPRDDDLTGLYAWVDKPNQELADRYIDRYAAIAAEAHEMGPAYLSVSPGPLCKYCPSHQPHAVDLAVSCPGTKEAA